MDSHNIHGSIKVMLAGAAVSAGNAINNEGPVIDMQGFDGAIFLAPINDSVATGVATATVREAATSGGAYAALAGAQAAATCVNNDDINGKFLAVDVFKPRRQFLRLHRASATANIAYEAAVVILYNAHARPTALGDVLARVGVVSPALA